GRSSRGRRNCPRAAARWRGDCKGRSAQPADGRSARTAGAAAISPQPRPLVLPVPRLRPALPAADRLEMYALGRGAGVAVVAPEPPPAAGAGAEEGGPDQP